MKKLFRLNLAVCLFLSSLFHVHAQWSIRNAVSDSESSPNLLVEGVPGSGWKSGGLNASASFLLDSPLDIEAEYVHANGEMESPTYQFMGSSNYRDWELISWATAGTDSRERDILTVPLTQPRYLRFVSKESEPVDWKLAAGTYAEVEQEKENFKPVDWGDITDPANITEMMALAFSWQMEHLSTRHDSIGWINGAFYTGVSKAYETTGDSQYKEAILDIGNEVNWTLRTRTSGKRFYHADDHCIGQAWIDLYLLEPESARREIWIEDVKERLDRIMADPLPGREDMNWCDALYMSPPNYVRMAEITGNDAYREFIDNQWWDVTDYLYDEEFHLFYRDASYFDDREPNGSPVFWSRGNGWVMGGLVRMLEYIPQDWPTRDRYLALFREMSAALADIQGESDGLWSSSLLYPEKYDFERETSGSAFFTYAMAWGVNEGILDAQSYGPIIEKAWEGLVPMLAPNGVLRYIQQVGAGPAPNNGQLYDKDYGYGAFLLAGSEMMRYFNSNPARSPAKSWNPVSKPVTASATSQEVSGEWTPVDDFENSYDWTERKTVSYSGELVQDPYDPSGNKVLSIFTGHRTSGEFRITKSIPSIPDGSVATVYQRFAYSNPEIDVVFGISDVPVVDNYGDYENGLRIYFDHNQMEARAGGKYTSIGKDLLQLETWYEAWTVIDNAADTYDVYLRGGSNYPQQVLLQSDIPFRNGTSSEIRSYAISYNTQYCEGSFYLDDLFVDTSGANLSRPDQVSFPVYSPWSHEPRDPETHAKYTDLGYIWDEGFPWIYHANLNAWAYIWPHQNDQSGNWAWILAGKRWLWLSSDWFPWYYDTQDNQWKLP